MQEYISREAIRKRLFSYYSQINENTSKESYDGTTFMPYEIADMISDCLENEPTADVAPVRHGRWIIGDGEDNFDVKCSECGWTDVFGVCGIEAVKTIAEDMYYCQNCGACMDLEE